LVLIAAVGVPAQAEVRPHALFSDGAVLQRGLPIPVWGLARDGERIKVTYLGNSAETVAKNGTWRVDLPALESGGGTLRIEGDRTFEFKDVLVGEVWIDSGQSNMDLPLHAAKNSASVIAGATDDKIRFFDVFRQGTRVPQRGLLVGKWKVGSPKTAKDFSAVAYHFGKALRDKLGVPIGLINATLGGSTAETWTPMATLEADKALRHLAGEERSALMFNGMIAPLMPYGIRGVIWYQGEGNADRGAEYRRLFPEMIRSWRERWEEGDFPFLFVQLAPFQARTDAPVQEGWADLREAQFLTLQASPNTAMVVITDLGDEQDIHPRDKAPVGARLALAARKLAYGEDDLVYSGPTFASATVEGEAMIVNFENVGGGLVAEGGALTGFALAGPDGKFVHAEARIDGDTVVVTAPGVRHPRAVRFGWVNFPVVNLYNKEGLPASPFRSDVPRE